MKARCMVLAVGFALIGGFQGAALGAEEGKMLPTLLIKGEVISVDANDPSATLLKVKDRYGFETPIYLEQGTKITQGEAAVTAASLTAGTAVEVEYNFDVNTAKRHAVSVKLAVTETTAIASAPAGTGAAQQTIAAPAGAAAAATSSAQPIAPVASPASPVPSAAASPAPQPAAAAAPATAPTTPQ